MSGSLTQDYAALADPVDEVAHVRADAPALSPERALLLELIWSALRDKDMAWVDGTNATVSFEDACGYLGFDAEVLRAQLHRAWPKRAALNMYFFAKRANGGEIANGDMAG